MGLSTEYFGRAVHHPLKLIASTIRPKWFWSASLYCPDALSVTCFVLLWFAENVVTWGHAASVIVRDSVVSQYVFSHLHRGLRLLCHNLCTTLSQTD